MNIFRPKFRRAVFFAILAIVCFIVTISYEFIPSISNIFAGGVFVFTLLSVLTFILFILTRKGSIIVKIIILPISAMFGVGILMYAFIFSGFSVRDAEKFEYRGETYYYRQAAATYKYYNLYRQNGPFTMTRLDGMTSEETRQDFNQERLEDIIDRIESLSVI